MRHSLHGAMASLLLSVVASGCAAEPVARWFPPAVPAASAIEVVDLRNATEGDKLALTTLQGLVNRDATASAYLLLSEWDPVWGRDLRERGLVTSTTSLEPLAFVQRHTDRFTGAIVVDPAVPASINVATMMASLDGRIVVMPGDEAKYALGKPVENLAGRWRTNVEAQQWAFDNLWPRMNHGILACFHPTSIPHHLRDYLVQQRVFTFWITSEEKQNGTSSNHAAERAFAEKLFAATAPNSPVIGFWGSGADHGITEYAGVKLAGEHGLVTVPCDWGTNLSYLGGVKVDLDASVARYRQRAVAAPAPVLDASKVYLAFVVIDSGDAAHYWQSVQYKVWEDPARGRVPINWSLGFATSELYPSVLAWHYERATPADTFFCGMSGLGYSFPYLGYASRRPDPDAVRRDYLARTNAWMPRLALSDFVLYTDSWKEFDREANRATTESFADLPNVRSLILGFGRDGDGVPVGPYFAGNGRTLVGHTATRWDSANVGRNEANVQWLVDEIRAHTPASRPAFVHVQAMSWSFYPSDLEAVAQRLGETYVAVGLDHLDTLCRAHLAATAQP